MKFSVLASILICIILLGNLIRQSRRTTKKKEESFWDKERRSNSVRRKSLEGLSYITIPDEFLHFYPEPCPEPVASVLKDLAVIKDSKICNLTGITNTDLKLTYGTANLPALSEYDQNYTVMARSLQRIAESLHRDNRDEEAVRVLEFLITTRTDVSATYRLLSDLYRTQGTPDRICHLTEVASNLNSVMRKSILAYLSELSNE